MPHLSPVPQSGGSLVSLIIFLFALTQNPDDRKVANAANEPQQATVCQILENLRMYDGKVVAIQVVNFNLVGQCKAPTATDDPRLFKPGTPPVNEIALVGFPPSAMAGPLGKALHDYDRWLREGYDISMNIVGRIDVRLAESTFGFGHLGAYPAQITVTQIDGVKRSAKKGPKRKKIIPIE